MFVTQGRPTAPFVCIDEEYSRTHGPRQPNVSLIAREKHTRDDDLQRRQRAGAIRKRVTHAGRSRVTLFEVAKNGWTIGRS